MCWLLIIFATNSYHLAVSRLLCGIFSCGIDQGLVLYVSEIADDRWVKNGQITYNFEYCRFLLSQIEQNSWCFEFVSVGITKFWILRYVHRWRLCQLFNTSVCFHWIASIVHRNIFLFPTHTKIFDSKWTIRGKIILKWHLFTIFFKIELNSFKKHLASKRIVEILQKL